MLAPFQGQPRRRGKAILAAAIMLGTILVCSNLFNGVIAENFEDVPQTLSRLVAPFKRLGDALPKEAGGAGKPRWTTIP